MQGGLWDGRKQLHTKWMWIDNQCLLTMVTSKKITSRVKKDIVHHRVSDIEISAALNIASESTK